ncbi:rhamnan synthesis F family protein [Pseudomonas sp. ME-P-057]|uniref:rhamnan synthesis F family protein n=1 Tax=Pseudomonas sp. ME-P-057 TaxID=3040321 RepID=UPI002554E43F|nr:rhamnan synthesis F family protein [Pseudomonas sp. ME-P-057]
MTTKHKLIEKNLKALTELINASGAFDKVFYRSQRNGAAKKHNDPIAHYLKEGWKIGLNPHPCFDTHHYVQANEDVRALNIHPFLHFVIFGYREDRFTSENFSLTDYRRLHPDIAFDKINPLKHFTQNYGQTKPEHFELAMVAPDIAIIPYASNQDEENLLDQALRRGFFDFDWYKETYGGHFATPLQAFQDYLHKSRFSQVNPSPAFDNETYHRMYSDVYHAQMSPLTHFLLSGEAEGRAPQPVHVKWRPSSVILPKNRLTAKAKKLKIAICFHIFYEDYIERFSKALDNFPLAVDVFITLAHGVDDSLAREAFGNHVNVKRVEICTVPNRGRNFGPLLTEYAAELSEYDLFCHLHSKKSLYSGREQHQWAEYLTEFLLRDPRVTTELLNAFADDTTLGLYYPTTFWMMPSWVNHVTMNKGHMNDWYRTLNISAHAHDFLAYPAGGMFWARPQALKNLLELGLKYEDFPEEPLPNDGSSLHALERILGPLAASNGYRQFFYYPETNAMTTDDTFIMMNYHYSLQSFQSRLKTFSHVSFDVFDTLVRRKHTAADYAKFKLGKEIAQAKQVESAHSFVQLRNDAEYTLRKRSNFQGDVSLKDIYMEISAVLNIQQEHALQLMEREFELDLDSILAKNEMVDIFNGLASAGHILWVISDTYYSGTQVSLMLRKAGIAAPYRLLVSSEEKKRKDNGSMWHMVKSDLRREGVSNHVHVGDNVVADSQIPGDLGLTTIHILHPMDKWRALGFPDVLTGHSTIDESSIHKWGALISNTGRIPFIGE